MSRAPPVVRTKTVSRHCQMLPGGEIMPWCEPLCQKHKKVVEAQRIESSHLGKSEKWCWSWVWESIPLTHILSTNWTLSACLCMKVNRRFLDGGKCMYVNSTMCSGNGKVFDICDLWHVRWAAGKWILRAKDDQCRKSLGPQAKGIGDLEFTLWVLRVYRKILSKRFLCSNHTDCVDSWQNSYWKAKHPVNYCLPHNKWPLCLGPLAEWIPQMMAQRWVPWVYSSFRKIHLCPFLCKACLYNSCEVRDHCCVCQKLEEKKTEMEEKSKWIKQFAELHFPDALISDFQHINFSFWKRNSATWI